jgi:hypothetical protein
VVSQASLQRHLRYTFDDKLKIDILLTVYKHQEAKMINFKFQVSFKTVIWAESFFLYMVTYF